MRSLATKICVLAVTALVAALVGCGTTLAEDNALVDIGLGAAANACARIHDGPADAGPVVAIICREPGPLQVAVDPAFAVAAQAKDGGVGAVSPATAASALVGVQAVLQALPAPADAGGQ